MVTKQVWSHQSKKKKKSINNADSTYFILEVNKSSFQRAPFWGSCIEKYYVQVSSSWAHLELLLWVKPVESATEENHAGALLHTVRTRVCAYKAHVWIQSFILKYLSITMLESPPLHFNGFKTLCLEVFWRTSFFHCTWRQMPIFTEYSVYPSSTLTHILLYCPRAAQPVCFSHSVAS